MGFTNVWGVRKDNWVFLTYFISFANGIQLSIHSKKILSYFQ